MGSYGTNHKKILQFNLITGENIGKITPEKIKIGYKDYKLEEWKQTVASANEAQGQFFSKEGIIGYTGDEKREY